MKLSYNETKRLIFVVLTAFEEDARSDLHEELEKIDATEGQFYDSIVEHKPGLHLTTDEWFELLSRLPNRFLRSQLDLPGFLSEDQIKRLPPVTGKPHINATFRRRESENYAFDPAP